MRKHLSVLMLAARGIVWKLMVIVLMMGVAQAVLFLSVMNGGWDSVGADPLYGLETVLRESHIDMVCRVAFGLLCILTGLNGCERSNAKSGYTLRRLCVSERTVTFWWALCNTFCFLIFWSLELMIVLILCRLYLTLANPALTGPQTVFLAFYRNSFLHSLLPLAETSRHIRNVILCIGLGVTSACFSARNRRGEKGVAFILLAAIVMALFSLSMGSTSTDLIITLAALWLAVTAVYKVWREPEYEA